MAIFLDETSRIIVQGMTGSEGMKHTRRMLASGATVVAGVNARKAGTKVDIDGMTLPVFAHGRRGDGRDRRRCHCGLRSAGVHEGLGDRSDRRRASRSRW